MLDICITAHETGPPHLVHIARTTKSFFWALGSINPRPSAGWATPAHLCHRHPAGPGDDFGVWWPEMVFFILLTMIPCVCVSLPRTNGNVGRWVVPQELQSVTCEECVKGVRRVCEDI